MATRAKKQSQDFLLEIGCEELPSDYMPHALNWGESGGLAASTVIAFKQRGIPWSKLRLFGTPRRLVLLVKGVPSVVEQTEEGPPEKVAFDASGKPTRAAEAFAKKYGVPVSKLTRKQTDKGVRLVLERTLPIKELLRDAIPNILNGVGFPKTMRWDSSGVRFARPIRWLLALYGSQVIPCAFGQVKSGDISRGLRRADEKETKIPSASDYCAAMQKLKIALEEGQALRRKEDGTVEPIPFKKAKREKLLKQLETAAKGAVGRLPDQTGEEFEWLLNTVTFLAEDPVVAVGSFRKEYLDLPVEVLATSMAKHLKLFSIFTPDGKKLLPKFLAVLEGTPKKPADVMANIERIIEARFTDARFFYKEDTRTSLDAKAEELGKVIFHGKLGTVVDRISRLEHLIKRGILRDRESSGQFLISIERVVRLCKADLVTQLVREFPSLQGTIGAHYARHDGELEEVVQAIAQQYQPRIAHDPVPSTSLGALISLADRIDMLIGYFGVGLKPTGSVDPFGLRRQALGAVRILLLEEFRGLSIDTILDEGIQSWGSKLTVDRNILKKDIRAFLRERFEWLVFVQKEIDRDLIASVLAAGDDNLAGAWERLKVLQDFYKIPLNRFDVLRAAKVAERTGRIVTSAKKEEIPNTVNPDIFHDSAEKILWNAWNSIKPTLKQQISDRQYIKALQTYSSLYEPVDAFFKAVLVMDENPEIRRNRLAFMSEIHQSLAAHFADLSKLSLAGVEPS